LTFYNLRKSGKLQNNVGDEERKEIWIPNLIFDNSVGEMLIENDKFSVLTVLQNGTGLQKTNEYLQENIVYKGSENYLVYSRTYKMDLGCEFEQQSYPFDSQTCSIEVSIYFFQDYHYQHSSSKGIRKIKQNIKL
jgi:hypothetical protein